MPDHDRRSWEQWDLRYGGDCTQGTLSLLSTLAGFTLRQGLQHHQQEEEQEQEQEQQLASFLSSLQLETADLLDGVARCQVVWRRGQVEVSASEAFEAGYMTAHQVSTAVATPPSFPRPEVVWSR